MNDIQQLTESEAIKLYESGIHKKMTAFDIALFQLFQDRLCFPFAVFKEALATNLNRPVYTHELCESNRHNIIHEFLGIWPPPTSEQLMKLIPSEA